MTQKDLMNLFLEEEYMLGADFYEDNIITPQNVFLYKRIVSPGISAIYTYILKDTKRQKYDLETVNIVKFATKDSKKEIKKLIQEIDKDFDICTHVNPEIFRNIK